VKTIRCVLKKGKEKPLEGRHPWVFSGAIDQIDEEFKVGDLVRVYSAEEKFLGVGYLNPRSQIAIRMLAFEETKISEAFFERRIRDALTLRKRFIGPDTNAYRVIHSEGDFLPGLIVDRYADYLVIQFLTAGINEWRGEILSVLKKYGKVTLQNIDYLRFKSNSNGDSKHKKMIQEQLYVLTA